MQQQRELPTREPNKNKKEEPFVNPISTLQLHKNIKKHGENGGVGNKKKKKKNTIA